MHTIFNASTSASSRSSFFMGAPFVVAVVGGTSTLPWLRAPTFHAAGDALTDDEELAFAARLAVALARLAAERAGHSSKVH